MDIIAKYGTPLKLTYLPKISEHIKNARLMFKNAMMNTITRVTTPIVIVPSLAILNMYWTKL